MDRESIKFLYPKIWDLNPDKIKCFENLKDLKITKKQGRQDHAHVDCAKPCRICRFSARYFCFSCCGILQLILSHFTRKLFLTMCTKFYEVEITQNRICWSVLMKIRWIFSSGAVSLSCQIRFSQIWDHNIVEDFVIYFNDEWTFNKWFIIFAVKIENIFQKIFMSGISCS